MKRRSFIRNTLTGAALIQLNPLYSIEPRLKSFKDGRYVILPEGNLPIIDEVDVIVAGATTGGISAALQASKMGSKVFLVAYQPYMGEDICGTYKFFFEKHESNHPLINKLFPDNQRSPLYAKKILENEIIDNNINFLYCSYVSDVLFDEDWKPAGVIISNRTSRQVVLGKVLIDATHGAWAGRLAGIEFTGEQYGKSHNFSYIAIGNTHDNGTKRTRLPLSPVKDGKVYQTWEYSFDIVVNDWSFNGICDIEQKIRSEAWDPGQVDSADNLFFIPPSKIKGKKSYIDGNLDIDILPIEIFEPKTHNGIFILGTCADISREAATNLQKPVNYIIAGEKVGNAAAMVAASLLTPKNIRIKPLKCRKAIKGIPGVASEELRPSHLKGEVLLAESCLPVAGEFDIIVVGGGTAGANAGISAGRHGMKILVIEYLHGLGGIGTMGLIGRYWDGYREGFTQEIDTEVDKMGDSGHPLRKSRQDEWAVEWKKEWYRIEILKSGGKIWFGATGFGAVVENGKVKGVIVATPDGLKAVLAKIIIDSTGSGDIAVASGAEYKFTDHKSVGVQGCGLPPINLGDHYNNTDWTFTDDNDALDITRLFIAAKTKYQNYYDLGKLSQSRERRRIVGDYEVQVTDIMNKRTYPDTISFHKSSFDTHGFTVDPFFTIRQPSQRNIEYYADLPLRSLLPKNIDNIIVTGLGASAHRDAMPVLRMQACLQNQGYSVGYLCSMVIKQNTCLRKVNIKEIQAYLVSKKILPERVLTDYDNYPLPDKTFKNAIKTLSNNYEGLQVLFTDIPKSISLLKEALHNAGAESEKIVFAQILCMLGDEDGVETITETVKSFKEWDEGWNFRGMHQFGWSMGKLDSYIIALGTVKREDILPVILDKAGLLKPNDYFSHFRAIALACESYRSREAVPALARLLNMEGVTGNHVTTYPKARDISVADRNDNTIRNNVLKELHIARALFRCGDHQGMGRIILENYASDLHGHYFRHAIGVLREG